MNKIKVAVLGCTGLVGQQFVRMLDRHPWFQIKALAASGKSVGKPYGETADWIFSNPLSEEISQIRLCNAEVDELKNGGVEIVFSALPVEIAAGLEQEAVSAGLRVFSNTSSHRMDNNVPILIPEVNAGHLKVAELRANQNQGYIITNPNCSTVGLAIALAPLVGFGLRQVIVSTYQAISGAGRNGLGAFSIQGNIIPHISGEEEKMEQETAKIFGRPVNGQIESSGIKIIAQCLRVPIRDGHIEAVTVELEEAIDPEVILSALKNHFPLSKKPTLPTLPETPLLLRTEPDRPQPVLDVWAGSPERARGMAVTLGRIRVKDRHIQLILLLHNTVRGAAGTSILSAELATAQGLVRKNFHPEELI